jgi:DNA invertase Pin-like site-specific DNA recombinase
MRVVAMFRVSTEKQATEGTSLEGQQQIYRKLAAREGWTTVAEFKGQESATGASSDRRVLQQVLACIRDESPDMLYVHEQSRLTRGDMLEVALLMRELEERRVKINVQGVTRDLASLDERFMVGIQSLVDRNESARTKERLARGKRQRGEQGRITAGKPGYGYSTPPRGTPGHGVRQVVPEQAVVVKKIFAMAVKGVSPKNIAKAINAQGVRAPRGGTWGGSTVARILSNPLYIGTSLTCAWVSRRRGARSFKLDLTNPNVIIKEQAHEAIIDRTTWDAFHGRARVPRTAVPRMLTGLLFVGGLQYHSDTDGIAIYRAERGIKGRPRLSTEAVDSAVWDAFASLATSPEYVGRLMDEAGSGRDQQIARDEIDHLERQVGKLERRLISLTRMCADGDIDRGAFRAQSGETQKELDGARSELARQKSQAVLLDRTHAPRVVAAVRALVAGTNRLTTAQKSQLLRTIVRRVDVEVAPTGSGQRRGKGGAFAASGGPTWAVTRVSFRLALAPAAGSGAAHNAATRPTGRTARVPAGCAQGGSGQLDTNLSNCGQLTASADDRETRSRQLDTTF